MYPYVAEQQCQNCQSPIIVRQKRDKDNQFCSKECYNQYRRRGKPIKISYTSKYICLHCQTPFSPGRNTKGMYCSYACSNGSKSVRHKLTCECCGMNFEINNIAEIKRGHYKYCSNECRKRKYRINEDFFNQINQESSYWLGFIWATIKDNIYNKINLIAKKELLERFSKALDSNYPIKKTINDRYRIKITSLRILSKLADLSLKEKPYLDFPEIPLQYHKDFIRGYFDSDWGFHYKDKGKDVVTLHSKSSKLMRYISEFLESNIVYSNGEWATISFDFYDKIIGNPFDENKWSKFN